MSKQIFLVTAPDEIVQDGTRLVLVNLFEEQNKLVSACLNKLEDIPTTVIYIWNTGDDFEWFLDKKNKSSLIIFNAEATDEFLIGYLAAQPNSYYFGLLRLLNAANPNEIIDEARLTLLLQNYL